MKKPIRSHFRPGSEGTSLRNKVFIPNSVRFALFITGLRCSTLNPRPVSKNRSPGHLQQKKTIYNRGRLDS